MRVTCVGEAEAAWLSGISVYTCRLRHAGSAPRWAIVDGSRGMV